MIAGFTPKAVRGSFPKAGGKTKTNYIEIFLLSNDISMFYNIVSIIKG